MTRSGFAAMIGRPNAGKSTLMNQIIGQKIAITSYKPQTTRTKIRSIYTEERGQIVFLDTPGLHRPKNRLGNYMQKASVSSLNEVDVVLLLTAPRPSLSDEDKEVLDLIRTVKSPVILVINKIDTVPEKDVAETISMYAETGLFAEIVPVSALNGKGVDELLDCLFKMLPEGPYFYDEDQVTTETQRDIAGELIREKALLLLQEEVPHGIAVTVDQMRFRKSASGEDICDINASIICEKESHKSLVIGRQGKMLGRIGKAARLEIEDMLEMKVNLKLYVKVRKDWKDSEIFMKQYGYDAGRL